MRIAFSVLFIVVCTTMAAAQTKSDDSKRNDSAGHSALSASPDCKAHLSRKAHWSAYDWQWRRQHLKRAILT
jgi:hypothetical protein